MAKDQRRWFRRVFPTAHRILLERELTVAYDRVEGRVLVVGAGEEPYKRLLRFADVVIVSDVGGEHRGLDHLADVHALPHPNCLFDVLLAVEVFEHLLNPVRATAEIHRVLKNGGRAIVTVPFMFRIHGDPADYQRFSKSGLEVLFEDFSSIQIHPFGGRVHVISDILTTAGRPLFVLRLINWLFCMPIGDRGNSDCPSGYVVELVK